MKIPGEKVVIVASGSRGDVQPYVLLGLEIHSRGHAVTIATESRMQGLVQQMGKGLLGYHTISGDPTAMLWEKKYQALLAKGSILPVMRATEQHNKPFLTQLELIQVSTPPSATLQNSRFKVVLSPIGAAIQSILVPDCKTGKAVDVVLGYDNPAGFLTEPHMSSGATVGRVANRISGATFNVDGKQYRLAANEGTSSIHGGAVRWSKQVWAASPSADGRSVTFTYTSKDGESGYPGTVQAKVVYSIPANGSDLSIVQSATTDKATPINMLNHAYFNLKGSGNSIILDHVVQIPSAYYTPPSERSLVPTGQILSVNNSAYDFTQAKAIGKDFFKTNRGPFKGFDLNYVMPDPSGSREPVWWRPGQNPQVGPVANSGNVSVAATVVEPRSGLRMAVLTNAPGIQFYVAHFTSSKDVSASTITNKGGIRYEGHAGFCIEAQGFPNAVNTPTFPSVTVRPGVTWRDLQQ